ncbi:MAG: hypothetical protein L0Y56_15035, partial [Nitrospira sp.]|nr:hypothetical protein [Nitrospira sp.]
MMILRSVLVLLIAILGLTGWSDSKEVFAQKEIAGVGDSEGKDVKTMKVSNPVRRNPFRPLVSQTKPDLLLLST